MRETKEAIRNREHHVWSLVIQGASRQRIAAELGIAPESVSRIKKRVSDRLSREVGEMVTVVRSEQVQQLERIREEALTAWERSKRTRRTVTLRQGGEDTGGLSVRAASVRQVEASGDPRYLEVAIRCNAEIRRVLGIDAPVKADVTHRDCAVERMSDEQLAAVLAGLVAGTSGGAVAPIPVGVAPGSDGEAPET